MASRIVQQKPHGRKLTILYLPRLAIGTFPGHEAVEA